MAMMERNINLATEYFLYPHQNIDEDNCMYNCYYIHLRLAFKYALNNPYTFGRTVEEGTFDNIMLYFIYQNILLYDRFGNTHLLLYKM